MLTTAGRPDAPWAPAEPGTADPMLPLPYRVVGRRVETPDSVTVLLEPVGPAIAAFEPGQFTMLYARGIGEIAVSISGDAGDAGAPLTHTIRDVGAVSRALYAAPVGSLVGVRGPYGTTWDLRGARGRDVLVIAGGVGLAPLRPVVLAALRERDAYRRLILLAGAGSPEEFLYGDELAAWSADPSLEVHRTIDVPDVGWAGPVGLVTDPLAHLRLDPADLSAFVCGPEAMIRSCAELLVGAGADPARIRLSLERNMKCGIGLCGHCQLGPLLLCLHGPIVDYRVARPLLAVAEL